jgi:3-hydroxyacyl-CoA dehydrogenase
MDTAMRLGFNWPMGPFEMTILISRRWAIRLLQELQQENGDAYRVAPGLIAAKEARERSGAEITKRLEEQRPP